MESLIELEGIAIDDLARKFFANTQSECAFARARGAGDDDQGMLRLGIHVSAIVPRRSGQADILMMGHFCSGDGPGRNQGREIENASGITHL